MTESSAGDTGDLVDEYQLARSRQEVPNSRWVTPEDVKTYEDFKKSRNVWDFTDLIDRCLKEEVAPPVDVAAWFHDETQDSTRLELSLLRAWASSCPGGLTLAGDDQQALYGFRGATPDAFLEGEAAEEVLGTSYRLPETIRAFAHDYGERMTGHRQKEWRGQDREGYVYRPARGDWNPLRRGMGWRLKAFADERPTWAQAWTWVEMLDTAKAGIARGAKKLIKDALRDEAFAKAPFELYEYHAFLGEHLPTPGGDRIPWLVDNVLAKHRKPLDFPLRVYEAQGLSALSDKPRVMVGTVHSVKGGEADSVLLYPDISKKAWTSQTQDPGDLQRTVYVGMTRAKRRLLLGQRSEKSRAVRW